MTFAPVVGSILFMLLILCIPILHKEFSKYLKECEEEKTVGSLAAQKDCGEYDIFLKAAEAHYGKEFNLERVKVDYSQYFWSGITLPFYVRQYLRNHHGRDAKK